MTSGYYFAIFHFVAEEKKKTTKKQRHFMTGLPQVSQKLEESCSSFDEIEKVNCFNITAI